MSESEQPRHPPSPLISVKKSGGNPLGFNLEFRDRTALVSLRDRRVADRLHLDQLELEVPKVTFPFDLAGGAEQFRHRRCRLRSLFVTLDAGDLLAILRAALAAERHGIELDEVILEDGVGRLSGVVRVGSDASPFSARFALSPGDGLEIQIGFFSVRLFAWLPVPATTLVSQLGRALRSLGVEQRQASSLCLAPVRDLLRWWLPSHGWKVPDLDGLRIDVIRIHAGRITMRTARFPDELPADAPLANAAQSRVEREVLIHSEGAEIFAEAEQALRDGRLEEARSLYLGRGEVEPGHPLAARRLMEIGLTRKDRTDELADLIRDRLVRDPKDVHAWLCRAVMEQRQGKLDAGVSFEQAALACRERHELADALLAHLCAGRLLAEHDLERAIRNLEQLLIIRQDHHPAMFILADYYERAERWYRAIRLNLRLARQLADPHQVAERHARIGQIYHERLDDLERARKHLDAALTYDANHLQALYQQALVMQRRAQPTRAARLLGQVIDLAQADSDELVLLDARLKLAHLWEEALDDPAIALTHYSQVLALRPNHLDALARAGRLALELDQPDKAAEAFSRLLELEEAGEPLPLEVARTAGLALGRLYLERPDGVEEARSHFARVVELDPAEVEAWNALELIDRRAGSWAQLVDVLEQKASLSRDPEEVVRAILEAARVAEEKLEDKRRAEGFYRRALKMESSSRDALDGLSSLLKVDQRWSELENLIMDSISETMSDRAAADRWYQIGLLRVEHLGDLNGGLQAMQMASRLAPGDAHMAAKLIGLFREHQMYQEFVDLVARLKPDAFAPDTWTDLWIERAAVLAEQLDRVDEAIDSYERALAQDPEQLQALRALADLYFQDERWEPAREFTRRVLDAAGEGGMSGPGRANLHRRLARIELELGDRQAATEHLRTLLALEGDDEDAAEQLARLLRQDQRWEELAAFYGRRAERSAGEEAATLHTAAASIWWDKLEQIEPATNQYRAAVDAAPESPSAPARLASLQRLYGQLGRWTEVAEVLERRIALGQPSEAPGLQLALASVLETRLDRADEAYDCFEQALEIDPDFLPALLRLAEWHQASGDLEETLDFGRRALLIEPKGESKDGALTAERRAELALFTARAAWELGEKEDAARFYRQHMEAFSNRGFAGVDAEALERLELLLREGRQYEELALLYRRWLKANLVPDRRGGLTRSLALLLFEHLEQPDEAIAALDDYVNDSADDQAAVSELAEMLRKSSRWERLADLLDEHWQGAPAEDLRIGRLEELAEILQIRLHDPSGAIDRLRQLLALGHQPALDRLLVIYRQEGQYQDLVALLQQRARETEPPAAAAIWSEIGSLARDELKDQAVALDAFHRAFEAIPSDLHRQQVLDLLRENGEDEELAEFLMRCAADAEDPSDQRAVLLEHAEVCLIRLDRRAEALSSLRQALEIEAEESVTRRALALYEEIEDFEGVADMQELLVDLADDEQVAARRLYRLGQIYQSHLDAPERAAAAYQAAAQMDPKWMEPNLALAGLLSEAERWEELLEVKVQLADMLGDEVERAAALVEAAELAHGQLRNADQAVGLLRLAAQGMPEPAPVLMRLAGLLEEMGEAGEAADALEQLIDPSRAMPETIEGLDTPAALYRRLARLRLQSGEDLAAISAFERTLRQEPSDIESAQRLEQLYRTYDRHEDLAQMLSDLASRRSGQESADTWVAVARSWLEAEDQESAESALEKALTASPAHGPASELLAGLLVLDRDWPRLLTLLKGLPDELLDGDELVKATLAVFEGVRADPESEKQEIAACRLLLRVDPVNLDALQRSAHLLDLSGHADEAEQFLRRLDEQADRLDEQSRYELDLRLANIDFARGRIEQAEERLKRCIEARPDDPGPRAFLHKLYEGVKRFADRVELLLEEASRLEGSERFEKRRAAAQLLELELGDPEGAARLYAQVVEEEPTRLEAWRKLTELHRLLDKPAEQRQALRQLAELSSGDERVRSLRKAARLACDVLQSAGAREDLDDLLKAVPDDAEALERLIALDRADGDTVRLEAHLARLVTVTTDSVSLTRLLREQAELLIGPLDRGPDAVEVLEKLVRLLPSDLEALDFLYHLYTEGEVWPKAAAIMERRIGLVGTEKMRAPLWAELAKMRQEKLGDSAAAVEAWRQAASLEPNNIEPWQRLRELAVARKDRGLLIDALEALAAKADDPQTELSHRRALGLLYWSLDRRDDARPVFTRVLAIDADDLVARRFMVRLLVEQDMQAAVPHLRWLVAHPQALDPADHLLVHQQLVLALNSAEPDERIDALEGLLELRFIPEAAQKLAELYREVGKRGALANLLARMGEARQEDGAAASPWLERAELLLQDNQLEQAVEALERALEIDGDHNFEVAVRLAELYLGQGRKSAAIEALEKARRLNPDDLIVLERLAGLREKNGDWEETEDLLAHWLALIDGSQAAAVAVRLGKSRCALSSPGPAREAFGAAIDLDPSRLEAYERMEGLLEDLSDQQQGLFYLRWAGGPAAGARRPQLYLEAARRLYSGGDADGAARALIEVLRLNPANLDGHRLLVAIRREQGDEVALYESLSRWFKVEEDEEQGLALADELARLAEELGEDEDEVVAYHQACLDIDPHHPQALLALADLAYERDEWTACLDLYERIGDRLPADRAAQVALRCGLASLFIDDPGRAIDHLRWSLELDDGSRLAHKTLIVALHKLNRDDDASAAIDAFLAAAGEGEAVTDTLRELEEKLGQGSVRAHLLGLLADRQAETESVALWLERADILLDQGATDDAVVSLGRALKQPGEHAFETALKVARLQLDVLGDEQAGLDALEKAIDCEPSSVEVLSRLSDIYWSRGEWQRAAEITARYLDLAGAEEQPGLALRLGDVHMRLEDERAAQQAYERALDLDPAYRQAFERLEQLVAGTAERSDLAAFYLRWARSPAAGSRRAPLLLTAARQFERDGQVTSAIAAIQEALRVDPDNPSMLELLALLLGQENQWEELLDVLERRRQLADEEERRVAISFEMGQLCKEQLQDLTRAAEHFVLCLDLDPEHAAALEELADIRYGQRDWSAAGDLYSRLGDRGSNAGRFISAYRLGEILEEAGQREEALAHFRRSIEANPSFIPSRQRVLRILADDDRYEELVEAGTGLLAVLPEESFEDLELELHRLLADANRRLLNFDAAAEACRQILKREGEDLSAIRALVTYHSNRREWALAAELIQRELMLNPDQADAAERWERLGDIMRSELADRSGAESAYGKSISLDSSRTSTAWKLWDLLCARSAWEEIRGLGESLLRTRPDPDQALELHRMLGQAWMQDGKADEKALQHFEQILESGWVDLEFIEEVAELARRVRRWPLYVSLAGQSLEKRLAAGLDPEVAMEGYLELARVYQEEMGEISLAANAVRRALELHPRDPELLRRLGHLYASNFDTYREAIEVFRELLGMDPTDPEFFRYLARLEAARGDTDRTACYYAGLRFLQPVDQEARRFLNYTGPAKGPQRALSGEEWSKVLLHPGADCLLQRVMAALAPYLERLFPPNMGRFQLIGQQASTQEHHQIHQIAERARAMMSGRPLRILIAKETVYQAWQESGPVPTLILSSTVLERSAPGELMFFVSREVAKIALGCVLPMKFGRVDLKQLLAIVSQLAEVDAEPLAPLPTTAEQYLDAIRRSVPGEVMETVLPLIRHFALEPRAHDLDGWLTGVNRTADRLGLLACGDLNAALSVLTRFSEAAGGRELAFVPDRSSLVAADRDILALFRFAFSEQMLNLRAELGVMPRTKGSES